MATANISDPHADQPTLTAGAALATASAAVILLHGRGGDAQDMVSLFEPLQLPKLAAFAPQAAGNSWYPLSFLAPIEANQPYLDSALRRIEKLVDEIESAKIPPNKIALLGFSQGACLTLEFAARHPRRYGAIIAFTGGLIGSKLGSYPGSLDGTPVFLGTSDPDPHVPLERVQETTEILRQMHANVDLRTYGGMPHTINQEELTTARDLLAKMIEPES